MSIHGSLAGQSWSHFHGISGTSTPSHSPRPPSPARCPRSYSCSEDVMKLPARDMHIFGICPSQDDFLLVICEICGKRIKLEAFESHNVARHGSQRQKDARRAMLNDKASALEDIKEDIFNNAHPILVPPLKSSSSSCKVPLVEERPFTPKEEVMEEVEEKPPEPPSSSNINNNVISIPDNEPLPAGMSKDLMAMVEESTLQQAPVVVPHLLKTEPTPKHSPCKRPRNERRPNARDREYHPDKHCGVWDNESKKHCTRALTCKSHSVLLKRRINGRSKSFDELVVEHKAVKEAAKAASSPLLIDQTMNIAASTTTTISSSSNNNGGGISLPPPPPRTILPVVVVPPPPSPPPEENLFYTNDHPRPLAVCTFGARRIANSLSVNRGDVFSRKVLRLAYASQHRFNGGGPMKTLLPSSPPSTTSYSPGSGFLLNNHHHVVKMSSPGLISTPTTSVMTPAPPPPSSNPQRLSTGIKLSSLQHQNNILLQDGGSFKTTDFSGIQFEFGK